MDLLRLQASIEAELRHLDLTPPLLKLPSVPTQAPSSEGRGGW